MKENEAEILSFGAYVPRRPRRQRLCFVESAERPNERPSGMMSRNRRNSML